ncbi:hypothetical protein EOD39_11138 [Acipenser ruthenus]|uniref:Uncharacterized protein n=1 Tax=Acipenser ruthenus TaxID=7906 RepID=A0A662YSQ1_ACIRT|nr:hypothetical protein EOD39_11138 [Acipenser ruthenus]
MHRNLHSSLCKYMLHIHAKSTCLNQYSWNPSRIFTPVLQESQQDLQESQRDLYSSPAGITAGPAGITVGSLLQSCRNHSGTFTPVLQESQRDLYCSPAGITVGPLLQS